VRSPTREYQKGAKLKPRLAKLNFPRKLF